MLLYARGDELSRTSEVVGELFLIEAWSLGLEMWGCASALQTWLCASEGGGANLWQLAESSHWFVFQWVPSVEVLPGPGRGLGGGGGVSYPPLRASSSPEAVHQGRSTQTNAA
jgi:hypothetical protein